MESPLLNPVCWSLEVLQAFRSVMSGRVTSVRFQVSAEVPSGIPSYLLHNLSGLTRNLRERVNRGLKEPKSLKMIGI